MPQVVIFPDVFQDAGSERNRRIAQGYAFDEGVDGRRLALFLADVRAAAEERDQLARQRLPLFLRHVRPDFGEKRDPKSLGQLDGRMAELGGRLQQMDGLDGARGVEELGLAREEVVEALLGIRDGLLGAGSGAGGGRIQRVLLLEEGDGGGKRIAVFGIGQTGWWVNVGDGG